MLHSLYQQVRLSFLQQAKCYEVFVYLPIGNMAVVIDTFITVTWAVQRLVYVHKPQIIEDHRYYLSCSSYLECMLTMQKYSHKTKPKQFNTYFQQVSKHFENYAFVMFSSENECCGIIFVKNFMYCLIFQLCAVENSGNRCGFFSAHSMFDDY